MKLIFMGTPDFSVPALAALACRHEIALVVTQPDRRSGRGKKVKIPPVKAFAETHGLSVFQPENVNSKASVEKILDLRPDLIIVVAYGQILKPSLLEAPVFGCVNIHASLLPSYRGAAPIHHAILNGERETGITIMQMDQGMDTGDILLQSRTEIEDDETAGTLHDRLSEIGAQAIAEALDRLEEGKLVPMAQDESRATYAPKLEKDMGRIDWACDSDTIRNRVRGLFPWPGAFTYYGNRKMKVADAFRTPCPKASTPGTILDSGKEGLRVATGEGCLLIKRIQFPNQRMMTVDEYLRGHVMEANTLLGRQEE